MPVNDDLGNRCSLKLRLHLREVHPAQIDVLEAIDYAQRLYGGNGICVEISSALCVGTTAIDYANLSVIDGECKWNQENTEQTDLHRIAGISGDTGVVAFFVRSIQTGSGSLNGCAGHAPNRPAVVISSGCTPWTMAHELGHVLLGPSFRPVHTEDNGNIMYKRSSRFTRHSRPTFSAAQLRQIRTSRYLTRV